MIKPYVHRVRDRAESPGITPVLGVHHGAPSFDVPAGACDCHVHVFGPRDRYPLADDRTFAPGAATVEDVVALHRRLKIDRLVIIQASVQGTDNRCVVDALRQLQTMGREARAVAVVPDRTPHADLKALHAAGVRGLRVNLQSYGRTDPVAAQRDMQAAAATAAEMGWHVQTYTTLPVIKALADAIARLPVPLVVDHFALADPAQGLGQPGLAELLALVRSGQVYVKLSAPYRIVHRLDGTDGQPLARAFIDAGVDRMLWGTDWPHTTEPLGSVDDHDLLRVLTDACGDAETLRTVLVDNPCEVYGFERA